jgi:hypothetical protein
LILNGKSWPVEAVAESGMVADWNDEVEDANDDPLGRPSVWSSSNRGLLAPSGSSMVSPYFIFIYLAGGILEIPTAGGVDAGSGTSKLSRAPSASQLSSIPKRMLVLLGHGMAG